MSTPKDILVVSTGTLDGLKVTKYIKPVSAHIVAGTNLFSDFLHLSAMSLVAVHMLINSNLYHFTMRR